MPLTSLDKIRQIRKGMGNPATGEVSDEDIAGYLHLAEKQLALEIEFEALTDTEDVVLDGSTDYTLTATDVLRIIEPPSNITSNHPMKLVDLRWDRQEGQYIASGSPYWVVPVSISVNECKVRFRPVGTGVTVRIPFIKVPTAPGSDSSTENYSDLPESFDMTVMSLAVAIGLELTDQRGEAKEEVAFSGLHRVGAGKSMPKSYKHYWLQSGASRLLGWKRGRRR